MTGEEVATAHQGGGRRRWAGLRIEEEAFEGDAGLLGDSFESGLEVVALRKGEFEEVLGVAFGTDVVASKD